MRTLKAAEMAFRCPTVAVAKALLHTRLTRRLPTSAITVRSDRSAKHTDAVKSTSDTSATARAWVWTAASSSSFRTGSPVIRTRTPCAGSRPRSRATSRMAWMPGPALRSVP